MLTDEQKTQLKAKLQEERARLVAELQTLGSQNPANPTDWIPTKPAGDSFGADRNDNADIIEEMHENNASLYEMEGRLSQVTRALEKMDAGTYGVCEISGDPIEVERLMANPAARTCVAMMDKESTLA
ncbi:MAG: TraR/DksA C4-type zinc finger protein [Patescibacteria group bacterium]